MTLLNRVVRVILAVTILLTSLYLIYAFAAGYLSVRGIWLPPPWNLVMSGLLLVGVAYAILRILLGPKRSL